MTLTLTRFDQTDTRTIGNLFVNNFLECYTLEDAVRAGPKVPGQTAIPLGRYRVAMTFSQRFQRVLPLLLDVPNFTGIRIHAGNTDRDTEGCILAGRSRGSDGLLESRLALEALLPKIQAAVDAGEECWIEIVHP